MGKKTLITDFTAGCVPKQLSLFMLLFMASNAMQVLYSIVDMIIVGQFVGKTAKLSSDSKFEKAQEA